MSNHERTTLEKLNLLIDKNLSNPDFSLDSICKELGISRTQLHRILKEHTQLSTTLYIRKRRLEKARKLLLDSKLRISEVADAVGINNPANFSKYFIEEYGLSPSDFRRVQPQDSAYTSEESKPNNSSIELNYEEKFIQQRLSTSFPRLYIIFTLLVLLLLSTGIFLYSRSKMPDDTANETTENSIAVLPFKNLGAEETGLFCDGVKEQIHNSLALFENLRVISQTSSELFRNSPKLAPQIANDLHVNYILEGSVLQMTQQIRITVKLIKANEDKLFWTKTYDGDNRKAFEYMSKVAKDVAEELNQKLSKGIAYKLERNPTRSMEAYHEFLKGKKLIETREKEKVLASITKLGNAIKIDSLFVDAYTYRAIAFFLLGESKYMEPLESHKMAEKDILATLKLDSENGLAYAVLANIYLERNKWEQANSAYKIALKYSPNDALINYWYSLMLRTTGNLDEAIIYSKKAIDLDPLYHVIMGGHLINYICAGKLNMAEKAIKDAKLLFNDWWTYHWVIGEFFMKKGDYQSALAALNHSQKLNPHVKIVKYLILFCEGRLGKIAEVQEALKSLPDSPENYTALTIIYAGLNDKERSLYYLQKNAAEGIIPTDLKVKSFYQLLRSDERYYRVIEKFGLLNPHLAL